MTVREDLQEAIAKAMEILEEKKVEEQNAVVARAFYNELVNEVHLQEVEGQVLEELAAKEEEMGQVFEQEVDKAKKVLEAAQRKYEQAEEAAKTKRDAAFEEYSQERKQYLSSLRLEHETKLAEAEMEVHTAKQRVTNLQNSFDRHCDNFKAQRGPDLKRLIEDLQE